MYTAAYSGQSTYPSQWAAAPPFPPPAVDYSAAAPVPSLVDQQALCQQATEYTGHNHMWHQQQAPNSTILQHAQHSQARQEGDEEEDGASARGKHGTYWLTTSGV